MRIQLKYAGSLHFKRIRKTTAFTSCPVVADLTNSKALVKTQPLLNSFLYLNVTARAQLLIYKCSSSLVNLAPGKLKRNILSFKKRLRITANVERGFAFLISWIKRALRWEKCKTILAFDDKAKLLNLTIWETENGEWLNKGLTWSCAHFCRLS